MSTTRDSSTDASDRYTFGYPTELSNQDNSISTAKRLRQRLQRQQSGQSGNQFYIQISGSKIFGIPFRNDFLKNSKFVLIFRWKGVEIFNFYIHI